MLLALPSLTPLRAGMLAAMCSLVTACGTSPDRSAKAETSLQPASVAQAETPALPDGLSASATAAGVPEGAILLAPDTLHANPSPDSYAYREDARQLANELAQTLALDPQWAMETLAKARYKESAARLMMPAPAGTPKNWAAYRSRFIEPIRVRAGTAFWRTHEADLKRAEGAYGVPASVIAGVLGVETIYGRQTGNFRVLDVLTTLSLDFPKGRSDRSAFFKTELGQFLKLCQEQHLEPESVLGSYAGAIGLPQFMPSSIRRYAVDFDNDGRIDLSRSPADAIGSVARYLAEHGWRQDWPAYFDITPPQDTAALAKLLAPDILPSFSAEEMQNMGATLPASAQNHSGRLALVLLENGNAAPTMIAGTDNFYAITRYNQSSYYALAVVQLGQAVYREVSRLNPQTP